MDVSIVIPARNEAPLIGECVEALGHQTLGASTLEVIVVAAGEDDTAGAAARVAAGLPFGRFEVVPLASGGKNAALQRGCARATAPIIVLLDADTVVEPDAVAVLARAVRNGPERAVHGAALPRFDTRISRYWELNRRLVKELRFDGKLSGELVAMRRVSLTGHDPQALFPDTVGAKDDLHLGRALAARGCAIGYAREARAVTMVPWTLRALASTMLRSRRSLMTLLPPGRAFLEGTFSAALIGAAPAALMAAHWSPLVGVILLAPLAAHVGLVVGRLAAVDVRGGWRDVACFLACDLLGRVFKFVAYLERVVGRHPPPTFRGERPDDAHNRAPFERIRPSRVRQDN
jgi:hypothetical protein